MPNANQWLEDLLSIREGIPHHGTLIVPKELRKGALPPESGKVLLIEQGSFSAGVTREKDTTKKNSVLATDDLKIAGITIFKLDDGILTFQFFQCSSDSFIKEGVETFAASIKSESTESKVMLQISELNFNYPISINNLNAPPFNGPLKGHVTTQLFGKADEPLDRVTILFQGLPEGWYGNKGRRYHQGVIDDDRVTLSEDYRETTIPTSALGWRKLSAFDFKVDGWSVSLMEIPHEKRSDSKVTHFCNIIRENKTSLTGIIARKFIKDNLFPFLSFLFGQSRFFQRIEGRKNGNLIVTETFGIPKILPTTYEENWFLKCLKHEHMDLTPQFRCFYELPDNIKKQWQKIIYYYTVSEQVAGTLHEYTTAASISFSALEGLTRSILNTYEDKDQWLEKEDLRLKRSKGILSAIEMVAKQELGKHSEVFKVASQQIRQIRNETMHLDLKSTENSENAYFRWNSSQALIEILLLKKMGMREIPNRTALGKFEVMGEDMLADYRKEELGFEE